MGAASEAVSASGTEVTEPLVLPDLSDPEADTLQLDRIPLARRRTAPRWPPGRRGQAAIAFALYLLSSVAMFGIPVLGHPTRWYVGLGDRSVGTGLTDPSVYMWALVWWPHAVVHGLNPFVTHLVWAPAGFNLARSTVVPGAAFLLWPVTALAGPIAAYNVVMLLCPALAAWTAYLLCRHVTGSFWASLVGGYAFGFSSYELAQMTAHLNLSLTFLIPLAVLLVLMRTEGRIGERAFVGWMAALLVLQFSFSIELFFTMTLFGGIALLLAVALSPPEARRRLAGTTAWLAMAYAAAMLVASPFLFYWAKGNSVSLPLRWPAKYSTDLANLVTPTRTSWLDLPSARPDAFQAGLAENGAYLGPFLVVVALFAWRRWRTLAGKLLVGMFALVTVASLGPELHLYGTSRLRMPWASIERLPFLRYALPARFMVFAWLTVALMTAIWLSSPARRPPWARWVLAGLCVAVILPNLSLPLWTARPPDPAFFTDGLYRAYLPSDRPTLVIPFGSNGFSMLWQAQAGMAFPMAGGYLACQIPPEYQQWAIVASFVAKQRILGSQEQLEAFLGHLDIGAVVVDPKSPGPWGRVFRVLPVPAEAVGGVLVYRLPEPLLAQWRGLSPPNFETRALRRSCQ